MVGSCVCETQSGKGVWVKKPKPLWLGFGHADEHAITLGAYFGVFNDLQKLRDLRTQSATQELFEKVFRATGNLRDVFPIISGLSRCISTFFDVFSRFSMFYHLYHAYCYLDGLSMCSPHYSIPNRCIPGLLRPSVSFIYLRTY